MSSDGRLVHATIVATGPNGQQLNGRWLVELDDGRQVSATVKTSLQSHRNDPKITFELGQDVWVVFHKRRYWIDKARTNYKFVKQLKGGRPQFAESVLAKRVEESKTKWATITDRHCPECNGLSPEWQRKCWVCEFELGSQKCSQD